MEVYKSSDSLHLFENHFSNSVFLLKLSIPSKMFSQFYIDFKANKEVRFLKKILENNIQPPLSLTKLKFNKAESNTRCCWAGLFEIKEFSYKLIYLSSDWVTNIVTMIG